MRTVRVVAAVIQSICENGEKSIFATARGCGEYKGKWEFPGGKIEDGETPSEALKREIKEELDTDIKVGELIDTIEFDYPEFHLSMDCFGAEVVAGNLELKEAVDAKWLTKETLDSVEWLPADVTILQKIKEGLEGERLMGNTIEYYNQNAEQFVQGTLSVDFAVTQERFLEKLFVGAYILDFGCGSGRDTKYFLDKGYQVEATDGSAKLCKLASEYTGIGVKQMLFEELDEYEKYDGIWACSSILHLDKKALKSVLEKMAATLKVNGVVYTSFKYGDFEGERNGRYFSDFTSEAFEEFMQEVPELQIEEYWITSDVRPGRGEEKWLNLILRKQDMH